MGRLCGALAVPFALWPAHAAAQSGAAAPIAPADTAEAEAAQPDLPDFRMPPGDARASPGPVRNSLIGAVPLARNLQIAVGRFAVPDIGVPRTEGADIRRRDRRIAALAFSFRF